jgi:hypothetical protein
LFSINLSAKARDALGSFIEQRRPGRPTRLAGTNVIARFDPNVEGQQLSYGLLRPNRQEPERRHGRRLRL